MELTKGMQMAVASVLKMLLPPDVLKVITPERTDKLLTDGEALVVKYAALLESLPLSLENIQDELASIHARLDGSTPVEGNAKRSRKRGSDHASEPGD